ncbi:hypothetical protein D3C80_1977790 [compost metagenome]
MFVRNLKIRQDVRKRCLVELGMGSGHRNLPDVHHPFDVRLLQQGDEILRTPVGVSDRVERQRHASCHT